MLFDQHKETIETTKPVNDAIGNASAEAYSKTLQATLTAPVDTATPILPHINTTDVSWNEPPRNMTSNERWQYEHMTQDERWRYNNLSRDQEDTRRHLNSNDQYDYDHMTPAQRDQYDRDH